MPLRLAHSINKIVTHDDNKGWSLELYNGSVISTVKGSAKTAVSLRSNLNFYDEALNIPEEFFSVTEPFAAQEKGFKTGVGLDMSILPLDIPNQIIYASSAGDDDSYLWKKYKENSLKMIMGIPGYFAVDISCDLPLHPTINGVEWAPLLTQQKIDDDMKANEAKAIREYYNKFNKTGGINSVFRRSDMIRYMEEYFPIHKSTSKDKKYVIAWDPALQSDNSILMILEYWLDKKNKQWKAKIANIKNMIQVFPDGSKHPMRTPDQIEVVRKTLVEYNGDAPPYENIRVCIDAGAGGGGRALSEHLWADWVDENGKTWPGIIDLTDETCAAQQDKYPHAKDVVRLMEPRKLRQSMFEAAAELVKEGFIAFPMDLPRTSSVTIDGVEHVVGEDDFKSFLEFDLLKEELAAFVKEMTQAGNINYKLKNDKIRTMHDDRAYAFVMAAFVVSELNRSMLLDNEERGSGMDEYYKSKQTNARMFNIPTKSRNIPNPFEGVSKPFQGLAVKR